MPERFVLAELVDVFQAPVDLGPVVEAAREGDVEAGTFTDEEVHWLRGGDRAPNAFLDAPRLAMLEPDRQQVALETAALLMTAKGAFDWDGDAAAFHGVRALIGGLRKRATALTVARIDHRDRGSGHVAMYGAGDELLLVEYVNDAGLHRFVLRGPELAARTLAVEVDPQARATTAAAPQTGRTVADLDPHPDDMVRTCEASSLIFRAEPAAHGEIRAQALTVYSGPDGVWVLAGRHPGPDEPGRVVWQQLDTPELGALLTAFLHPG